ncbi:MAG: hypothetical protein D6729_19640, partial [Deltaproteobacteria bacterium]
MEERILAYRRRLEAFPAHREAYEALAAAYAEAGHWDELAHLLEERLSVLRDTDEAVDLEVQLAELLATRLAAPERAKALLKRVIRRQPGAMQAVEALRQILEAEEAWAEAARLARTVVEGGRAEDLGRWWRRIAEYEARQGRTDEA